MASEKFYIEQSIIDWILTQNDTSKLKNETLDLLEKIKLGQKIPTFNEIENLSKKTNIPLGYFFLKNPPKEKIDIIEYRTIDSIELENPSRNLIDTVYDMQNIQEWMKNYRISSDFQDLKFVGSYKDEVDCDKIANNIREILKIDINWFTSVKNYNEAFKKLKNLICDSGILIMMSGVVAQNNNRKLDVKEFRAFTLIDNFAPLIFINSNDSEAGKIFSLLHELVHIWLGVNSFYNDNYETYNKSNESEKICNYLASEILVPYEFFIKEWKNTNKSSESFFEVCENLSKVFKCSKVVIARKALDNNFIEKSCYSDIVDKSTKEYELKINGKKKPSGGDYYNTMLTRIDNNFLRALNISINEGKTQYTEAYRLTNTNRNTFDKIIERAGVIK